jgi:hypothetical protein
MQRRIVRVGNPRHVQGILDNAAEFTAEQIASEIYELPMTWVQVSLVWSR